MPQTAKIQILLIPTWAGFLKLPLSFNASLISRGQSSIKILYEGKFQWLQSKYIQSIKTIGVEEVPWWAIEKKSAEFIDNSYKLRMDFDPYLIGEIKQIPNRSYEAADKSWFIPATMENRQILIDLGFMIDSNEKRIIEAETTLSDIIEIKGFNRILRPFQAQGVNWLEKVNGRGLIADDMGLGKTTQALAWLQLHPELRPALVICPSSLKDNWRIEAETTMEGVQTQILSGRENYDISCNDIVIINYDVLMDWVDTLLKYDFKVIVTDESHYFKNMKAQRTKAVKFLVKQIPHFIALSGTPIESRPLEFFPVLSYLNSRVIGNFMTYVRTYCNARHNGFGWDYSGASNMEQLHRIINGKLMIRRTKKEVLKELPDKQFSHILIDIENRKEYDNANGDFTTYLKQKFFSQQREAILKAFSDYSIEEAYKYIDEQKMQQTADNKVKAADSAYVLAQLTELKKLAAIGKLKSVMEWVDDFLEITDEKLILFAHHKIIIDQLMERYGKLAVKIDGSVPTNKRQDIVENFQKNPKIRLFVGNMKAAGVGITLTAASNVGIIEFPWTPGTLTQAIDRAHRIGQKNTVNVYFFVGKETIDQKLVAVLDEKVQIVANILDGKVVDDSSVLSIVLRKMIDL